MRGVFVAVGTHIKGFCVAMGTLIEMGRNSHITRFIFLLVKSKGIEVDKVWHSVQSFGGTFGFAFFFFCY